MSNFAFLQSEWSFLFEAAIKAEGMANTDARTSCFYARRTLELAFSWLYKHDKSLRLPYQDHLSALIHIPALAAPRATRFSPRPSSSRTWAIWPFTVPAKYWQSMR